MRIKSVIVLGIIILFCVGSVLSGCSTSQPESKQVPSVNQSAKTIGLIIAGSDACYNTAADVFEMRAKEAGWLSLRRSSDYQKVREVLHVEEFIAKKVDAIAMVTTDIVTAGQCAQRANEAGIPIFFFMTMPELPDGIKATAIVTSDWYMTGYLNGEYIAKKHPNARCALIEGGYDQGMTELIRQGFVDALNANRQSQARVIVNVTGSWMKPNAMAAMEDLLIEPNAFDVIFTYNEEMMLGVVEVLRERKLLGQYTLISQNGREDVGWKYILEGIMESTVEAPTSQEGDVVFQLMNAYFKGETIPYHVMLPHRVLTREIIETAIPWDANQYIAQIRSGHPPRNFRTLDVVEVERKWSKAGNNYENIHFYK